MISRSLRARALESCVVVLACIASASLPTVAFADASDCADAARVAKLKKDGNTAFGAGKLEDAVAAYERAYACDKDASLLFNMAKAKLKLGETLEALDDMRRFERDSQNLPKEIVDAADATIAELVAKVATVSVRSNVPGAKVTIGDRDLGPAPVENAEALAGSVTVRVTAPGREPLLRKVELVGGRHADVDASFEAAAAAAPTDPSPASRDRPARFRPSPLVFVGAGVAGAGLVVGVATGAASIAKTSDIKKSCPQNRCPASLDAERSKANALANASNVSLAIAAAGAIVGAVGIGLSFHHEDASATVSFSPTGLVVNGAF